MRGSKYRTNGLGLAADLLETGLFVEVVAELARVRLARPGNFCFARVLSFDDVVQVRGRRRLPLLADVDPVAVLVAPGVDVACKRATLVETNNVSNRSLVSGKKKRIVET